MRPMRFGDEVSYQCLPCRNVESFEGLLFCLHLRFLAVDPRLITMYVYTAPHAPRPRKVIIVYTLPQATAVRQFV
jgi:hypothetical protein